jgi:hypothetical protein
MNVFLKCVLQHINTLKVYNYRHIMAASNPIIKLTRIAECIIATGQVPTRKSTCISCMSVCTHAGTDVVKQINMVLAATTMKDDLLALVRLLSEEFYTRPFKEHHYLLCSFVIAPLIGHCPLPLSVMNKLVQIKERIRIIEYSLVRRAALYPTCGGISFDESNVI